MNPLGAWRPLPVEVDSDLPPDVALARLRYDLRPRLGDVPARYMLGTVTERRVQAAVVEHGRRRLRLRADVVDRPDGGCTIRGLIGFSRTVGVGLAVFTTIWAFFASMAIIGLVGALLGGHWGQAAISLLIAATLTAIVACLVTLSPSSGISASDALTIQAWLAGYRPEEPR